MTDFANFFIGICHRFMNFLSECTLGSTSVGGIMLGIVLVSIAVSLFYGGRRS